MKKALIFGVTGQDGSYLSELLILKGYEVHGVIRRSSSIGLSISTKTLMKKKENLFCTMETLQTQHRFQKLLKK